MSGEPLRIEGVEMTSDGGLVLVFDDNGAAKRFPLEAQGVPSLVRLIAEAMAGGGAGLELDAHEVLMKPPGAPGERPRLAFLTSGWPPIALALDWKVLQGLAQASEAALVAGPQTGGRQ